MLTFKLRTIEFYKTSSGHCPVEEFLDSLQDRDARKVAWVLRLVERIEKVPLPYFKKLAGTEQLWEIRVQTGGNNYRFLGFFDGPNLLILTVGFSKKKQKIPIGEIELAQKRRTDYIQRRTHS